MNSALLAFRGLRCWLCLLLAPALMAGTAHVHGEAQMTLVLDGTRLDTTIIMAAHDLLGFEHQPTDQEQLLQIESASKKLQTLEDWLIMTGGACSLLDTQVIEPTHGGATHHPNYELSAEFNCQNPTEVRGLVLKIHQKFPQIERTEVQWLVHNKQGLSMVNKQQEEVSFQ